MIDTLTAHVGAQSVSLSDGAPYRLIAYSGHGMATFERYTERGPLQHGASDRGFTLLPRALTLGVGWEAAGGIESEAYRDRLLALFAPTGAPVVLEATRPTGEVRRLDVYLAGGLDMPPADGLKGGRLMQRVALQLTAPDPAWYATTEETETLAAAAGLTESAIPTAIPTAIGSDQWAAQTTIAYAGTWQTHPVVEVVGPIADLVLLNEQTGERLALAEMVPAGETWTLDARYGAKSVTDQDGASRLDALAADHDLATFHLAPAPAAVLAGGTTPNLITVTGRLVSPQTAITVRYRTRWVGI